MGATDALFSALTTLKTSDTGTGGLHQTGGSSRLVEFVRDKDDKRASSARPRCVVSVTPMRSLDGRPDAMQVCEVRFTVTVSDAQAFTVHNAIRDRIRTVYNDVTPATTGGYSFSPMAFRSSFDDAGEQDRVLVEVYEVLVYLSGDARLLGYDADFSGYDGGVVFDWAIDRMVGVANNTGVMDYFDTHEVTNKRATFQARFHVTGLPPSPGAFDGCVFTLATGYAITANVTVQSVRTLAVLGQSRMQICEASGPINGEWTEDTP